MNLVARLMFTLVALVLSALAAGKITHPRDVWIHPSGEALFVVGESCAVDAPKPLDKQKGLEHYQELLSWCESSYKKAHETP